MFSVVCMICACIATAWFANPFCMCGFFVSTLMLVCSYVCMSSFSSLLYAHIAVVCGCLLQLALYSLGAMRDERLHRMFRQDRVKFRLPENDAEVRDFEGCHKYLFKW